MTIAYSSKNLKFPAEHLKILLLYHSLDDLFLDCKYFGVNCDEKEKMIHFLKGNFCDNQANVSTNAWRLNLVLIDFKKTLFKILSRYPQDKKISSTKNWKNMKFPSFY